MSNKAQNAIILPRVLLIKFLHIFCFALPAAHAQLVSGNAFLKGKYVELGIAPYGLWGTTVDAPAGYHARSAMTGDGPAYRKLGFVADPAKDGWTAGAPEKYKGDYFLPDNPYMGWGVTIGPARYFSERSNNGGTQPGFTAIPPGSITSVTMGSTQSEAVWESTIGNIAIRKIVTVPANKAYFTVRTVFTNTTAAVQNDVYYFEYINPDNDAVYRDVIAPTPDVTTVNSIVYQNPGDNKVVIKALGNKTASYLGLGTLDCRAKVVRGPAGDAFCHLSADQLYYGQGGSQLSGSDPSSRDNYMAIAFNVGTILPGDSTAVAYSYILSEPDLDAALEQTNSLFQAGDSLYHTGESIIACPGTTLPIYIINADALPWTWAPDPHLHITSGTRVQVDVDNVPVVYTASATSRCGSKQIRITVRPGIPPPPAVTSDIYYCLNTAAVPLSAGGTDLIWNTDPAANTGSSSPPTPSTAAVGTTTYYVRQVTNLGCISAPAAIHVTVLPTSRSTETVTICPNKLPYTWHGTAVSSPGNGVATFTVTNQYGCDSIISLNLVVNPADQSTETDTICADKLPYTWHGMTVSSAGNGVATYTITNQSGCDSVISLNLLTYPSAAINISKTNDINCLTPSAGLHATGGVSYQWEPADGLSELTIADPVVSPATTTTYHLKVTNDKGCIDTASVTVYVTPEGSYLLPNAFTPNGDGHNDCFGIQRAARTIDNLEFSVFNRMGQLVFHTNNPADCWDGTFKGQPQPTGAYVYFIKGKGTCGVVDQKGTVMLVR